MDTEHSSGNDARGRNISLLLGIARQQNAEVLRNVEVLDWKISFIVAAQAAILAKGTDLDWTPDRICLGLIWMTVSLLSLVYVGWGFRIRPYREQHLGKFRDKYGALDAVQFDDQLLSNYEYWTSENDERNKKKARHFNWGLVLLLVSLILMMIEALVERILTDG